MRMLYAPEAIPSFRALRNFVMSPPYEFLILDKTLFPKLDFFREGEHMNLKCFGNETS